MSQSGIRGDQLRFARTEPLEPRRLLCALELHSAEALDGPLPAPQWPDGAVDHDASWYEPVAEVSLSTFAELQPAGEDPLAAAPGSTPMYPATFSTNAAGLPLLTSRANGQGLKIFLDFDGYSTNLPFSLDADTATFNTTEQQAIYATWRDIISYFSALNVNVTTVQPPTGGANQVFAWHLTSNSISGGYAYVGSLSNSQPRGFNESNDAVGRRSGIAHEIGHLLNLQHQAEFSNLGALTSEYSDGWDNRNRPVMGVDYRENIRGWFYGRGSNSLTNLQDDLQVMASKVATVVGGDGFRPDDYAGTTATAYAIPAGTQRIEAFLERYTDADVFSFASNGERWTFDATPTFESAAEPKLELLDASGAVIAAADNADQRGGGINHNDVEFTLDLAPGNYFVRVSSSGDISELGEYLLTASPLMTGWQTQDVATLYRPGTVSFNPPSGEIVQLGGGTDIWGTSDQFRFSSIPLNGDGSITVRVDALDNTDAAAKAGIMIRQSMSSNSAHVMLSAKPSGALEFIRRTSAGASAATVSIAASNGPWLRLTRAGSNFTAARSDDGTTWTDLATTSVSMSGTVYLGLATASHNARYAAYATYSNLSATGAVGATPPTYNALPAPTGLAVAPAAGANTSLVLNWLDVAGETGYAIERSSDGVSFAQIATVGANVTTYTDSNVWGSMRWFYRVAARDGSANNSAPSTISSAINKPRAVSNPPSGYASRFSSNSTSAIQLNWSDVQGDAGYKVERSTDNITFSLLTTRPANYSAYNDSGLSAGQTYYYRITPVTSIGDGVAPSFTITAGTQLSTVTSLSFTGRTANSMSIQWGNIANETGYRIERSNDGISWGTAATVGANVTIWTDTAVSALTEYYYRVVGLNSTSGMESTAASSVLFGASPASAALPSGWTSQDIGTVPGLGAAGFSGGTWTLLGAGSDINSTADQFHFVHYPLNGNGEIIALVSSIENTNTDMKAGVMIRESLTNNSRNAFIAVTPGNGVDFQYRSGSNTTIVNGPASTAPVWVKLNRSGNVFTASSSSDGSSWTQIAQQTVSMGTNVYVGLATTSKNTAALARTTFTNVSGTFINAPPAINTVSASPSTVTGTTSQLSVSATDDGGAVNLNYSWTTLSYPGATAPTFSANNSNAASTTQATFFAAGAYSFRVSVTDAQGQAVNSSPLAVTVNTTADNVDISPAAATTNPGAQVQFSAAVFDQFGAAMPSVPVSWSAGGGSIGSGGLWTAPSASGPVTITATSGSASEQMSAVVNLTGQAIAFDVNQRRVRFQLNGDVTASLSNGDLGLVNLSTSQTVDPQYTIASFDINMRIATFDFSSIPGGLLPDGHYRATLPAGSISDAFGTALVADALLDFYFLAADANGDAVVSTLDFNILAGNFGQVGKSFSEGNFDYLGAVDSQDFVFFAAQYGQRLPAPALFAEMQINGGDELTFI